MQERQESPLSSFLVRAVTKTTVTTFEIAPEVGKFTVY